MNKRSAVLIAASLVGVLAVAGAAFANGITGPTARAASQRPSTVHRQAAPAPVVQAAPTTSSPSPSISGDDDGSRREDEGPDDHGDHGNEGPDDHGDHGNEGPDDHGDHGNEGPDGHGDHGNEGTDDHGHDDD